MFGLKYIPSVEPEFCDVHDWTSLCSEYKVEREFSDENQRVLLEQFLKVRDSCKCIVEIGVARNPYKESSTSIFLDNKLPETVYIGIDIEDKSFLNDKTRNIYTAQCDSRYKNRICAMIRKLGLESIDFLFIDGFHSVLQVIFDWEYVDQLSLHGIVGMHDTNIHPGPYAVFEAIDESVFNKTKYCEGNNDWGIAFAEYSKNFLSQNH